MRPNLRQLAVIPVILLLVCCFPIVVEGQQDVVSETGDLGYDSLPSEWKPIYVEFSDGIDSHSKSIRVSDTPIESLTFQKVQYAYQSDHPEKFWASYFSLEVSSMTGKGNNAIANPATFPSEANIQRMSEEIENATSGISITGDSMGDKIKCLQNAIIDNTSYNKDTFNAGNIYGAFVEKQCKCDGYSLAVCYLCKKNGINALCVIGEIKGEKDGGHAWNIIQMDNGKWYYLDTTWDDVSDYRHRYDYFLIGSETSTPSGTIKDKREIFYDYGIIVSADEYDYDPFAFEHMVLYIAIAVVAIVLVILVARAIIKSRRAKAESLEDAFARYEIPEEPAEIQKEDEKDDETRRNSG